jgi:hypothetical protein
VINQTNDYRLLHYESIEVSIPELSEGIPSLFASKQLEEGNDVVEGNILEG